MKTLRKGLRTKHAGPSIGSCLQQHFTIFLSLTLSLTPNPTSGKNKTNKQKKTEKEVKMRLQNPIQFSVTIGIGAAVGLWGSFFAFLAWPIAFIIGLLIPNIVRRKIAPLNFFTAFILGILIGGFPGWCIWTISFSLQTKILLIISTPLIICLGSMVNIFVRGLVHAYQKIKPPKTPPPRLPPDQEKKTQKNPKQTDANILCISAS